MPDPAVPVAAPDVVERLQRQLTIPLSIMGGESYVLDTDDVREATAEITRLRARVAELEGEVWALRRNADRKCGCMFNHEDGSEDVLHRCAYHGSRDARIAELEAALRAAQRGFADIGNSDRVDEIEDVLSPGWRERWQMDLSRALGDGHG